MKPAFRITARWVEAFDAEGGKGRFSHFNRCELREYSDGTMKLYRGPAVYLHKKPSAIFAHQVFCVASRELWALGSKPLEGAKPSATE